MADDLLSEAQWIVSRVRRNSRAAAVHLTGMDRHRLERLAAKLAELVPDDERARTMPPRHRPRPVPPDIAERRRVLNDALNPAREAS